jgi:hypothetical protein
MNYRNASVKVSAEGITRDEKEKYNEDNHFINYNGWKLSFMLDSLMDTYV